MKRPKYLFPRSTDLPDEAEKKNITVQGKYWHIKRNDRILTEYEQNSNFHLNLNVMYKQRTDWKSIELHREEFHS